MDGKRSTCRPHAAENRCERGTAQRTGTMSRHLAAQGVVFDAVLSGGR
jgi:hypothetical protein